MNINRTAALAAPTLALLALPLIASAHQVATYQIGNANYQIVVGSLNEPMIVDDKSGVDLTVNKCFTASCSPTRGDDGDMDGPAGEPVTGLDQTLKVTLIAGGQKKTLSLSPQFGKAGAYSATFFPTVATTMSYEFTGTIDNTPVDLTFTCLPEGTPKAPLDSTRKELGNGVTQTSISGGFGCALAKTDLGFPEQSATLHDIAQSAKNGRTFSLAAIALAGVALVFSSMRRRS